MPNKSINKSIKSRRRRSSRRYIVIILIAIMFWAIANNVNTPELLSNLHGLLKDWLYPEHLGGF
jgi:ABC-type phosphate/phosphonate transport system permease subunit